MTGGERGGGMKMGEKGEGGGLRGIATPVTYLQEFGGGEPSHHESRRQHCVVMSRYLHFPAKRHGLHHTAAAPRT